MPGGAPKKVNQKQGIHPGAALYLAPASSQRSDAMMVDLI
jgi:hypothetical protein